MITDKDVEKLSKVFATKEDLKSFATKDDLNRFATKDDLKKIREDIDKLPEKMEDRFVTKSTFHKAMEDLISYIQANSGAFKKEIVDELGGQIKQLTKEVSAVLKNHESRITSLENDRLN